MPTFTLRRDIYLRKVIHEPSTATPKWISTCALHLASVHCAQMQLRWVNRVEIFHWPASVGSTVARLRRRSGREKYGVRDTFLHFFFLVGLSVYYQGTERGPEASAFACWTRAAV